MEGINSEVRPGEFYNCLPALVERRLNVTSLEDRFGEFYNCLPALVERRLKEEYGFDALGQETVKKARALLADPAKIDRMCKGFPLVIREVLATKLLVLVQAGEAMAGDTPASEAAQKLFVPVAADPFTGKALHEGAAHTSVLDELSENDKMFVAFMRVSGYLPELGGSLNAQVKAIYDALRMGVRNDIIDQAKVEFLKVQEDPISMATLRRSLFVQAPGIREAASHFDFVIMPERVREDTQRFLMNQSSPNQLRSFVKFDFVIMSEEVREGTQSFLMNLFTPNQLRSFVESLNGGGAILALLPKGRVTHKELSEAVVEIFAYRGTFRDPDFWTKLEKERPERYSDVAPYRKFILGK